MNASSYPSDRRIGRLAGFVFLIVALVGLSFSGCSTSSPRFKSRAPTAANEKSLEQPRFSTREKEEETREDDRKVNVDHIRQKYASDPVSLEERTATIERKRVMSEVMSSFGIPYELGGNGSDGIDCSNFTAKVYENAVGHSIPRTTVEQFRVGQSVGNARLKFGDLVFFNTTGESPSHVGIFVGEDLFAHASVSFGVTISSLQSTYYKNRYIGARRLVE